MQDKRINVGDIMLQVREYEREGEAIIFLHFGGSNLMMWRDIVPYFQKDYHLVLIDQRGHGRSDKPSKGYHIDEMAQDIIAAMQVLDIECAHIVGSSLGAEVGLSIAANYPEQVFSLVCDGALYSEYGPYGIWEGSEAGFKEHADKALKRHYDDPPEVFPSVDALVNASRREFEEAGLWNEIFEAVKRYDATESGDGQYTNSWGLIAKEYMSKFLFYQFEDYYRRVLCPLLMLPDAKQSEKENKAMQGLCELTHQGEIVAIPGWVHPYGWMFTPESVSKVVLGFMAASR